MVSRIGGTLTPLTPLVPTRPTRINYKEPAAVIELPPNLRRPPRATDLIITKGFDGLTPDQAVEQVKRHLGNKLAPANEKLVDDTARRAYRDFNVALNNVFTQGSPNNTFLAQFSGRTVSVLGSMSSMTPVIYKVDASGTRPAEYYTRDWSGKFTALGKPPGQVVMEAKVRLSPPGLAMSYPDWKNGALAQSPLTTITEL